MVRPVLVLSDLADGDGGKLNKMKQLCQVLIWISHPGLSVQANLEVQLVQKSVNFFCN